MLGTIIDNQFYFKVLSRKKVLALTTIIGQNKKKKKILKEYNNKNIKKQIKYLKIKFEKFIDY